MYLAVAANREFEIVSGKGSWKQNEIGKMDIFVPSSLVDGLSLFGEEINIYRDGNLYWQGVVTDNSSTKGDGTVRLTQINALDPLGYLMLDYYAKTKSHYRDAPLTVLLSDLLSDTAGDWRLWKADTMADRLIKTTIDLTKKETLWAQMIESVKSIPNCFVRYGGIDNGVRLVDVGTFQYPTQGIISRDVLIDPLKFDRKGKMPLKVIKPSAGNASKVPISLQYALDARPWLATDPDYPITQDGNGDYIVTSSAITTGRKIAKHYGDIKAIAQDEGDATPEELQEAGLALYYRCIREFEEARPQLNVSATCALSSLPTVPSWWRVIGDAYEATFDYAQAKVEQAQVLKFNQVMAAAEVNLDFTTAGKRLNTLSGEQLLHERVSIKFNEVGFVPRSSDLLLAERVDENDDDTANNTLITLDSTSSPVVVTHSAITSDTVHSTGVLGKQFSFTLPAPPVGAIAVYATLEATEEYVLMDMVIEPALPATNMLVYATAPFRQPWSSATSVTITAQFYFVV